MSLQNFNWFHGALLSPDQPRRECDTGLLHKKRNPEKKSCLSFDPVETNHELPMNPERVYLAIKRAREGIGQNTACRQCPQPRRRREEQVDAHGQLALFGAQVRPKPSCQPGRI